MSDLADFALAGYRRRLAQFRYRLVTCHPELASHPLIERFRAAVSAPEFPIPRTTDAGEQWGEAQDIWEGDPWLAIFGALDSPQTALVEPVVVFFKDMALVEHLEEGRHLRRELEERFGESLPESFVTFAAAKGRLGVLRPFGVRLCAGQVSEVAKKRILDRVERAKRIARRLAHLFLEYDIGIPCRNCGEILDTIRPLFCSTDCEERYRRHERYVNSRDAKVG